MYNQTESLCYEKCPPLLQKANDAPVQTMKYNAKTSARIDEKKTLKNEERSLDGPKDQQTKTIQLTCISPPFKTLANKKNIQVF